MIGAFEEDQKHSAAIICLLRTVPFDLTSAIIDRDADLDIATFSVTEDQLISSEAVAIDCRSGWSPKKCTALSLAGFPEELKRIVLSRRRIQSLRLAGLRRRYH